MWLAKGKDVTKEFVLCFGRSSFILCFRVLLKERTHRFHEDAGTPC